MQAGMKQSCASISRRRQPDAGRKPWRLMLMATAAIALLTACGTQGGAPAGSALDIFPPIYLGEDDIACLSTGGLRKLAVHNRTWEALCAGDPLCILPGAN